MQKEFIEQNPLLKLTFDFSVVVIAYCERLEVEKKIVIANQRLKSSTSITANSFEAQSAESNADFIRKIIVAAKKANEMQHWLLLCNYSGNYPQHSELLNKLKEIQKVLNKILGSSKRNDN